MVTRLMFSYVIASMMTTTRKQPTMTSTKKQQQLTCTLKTGTVFFTAHGDTISHNPGTGCSLEVSWWLNEDKLQVRARSEHICREGRG